MLQLTLLRVVLVHHAVLLAVLRLLVLPGVRLVVLSQLPLHLLTPLVHLGRVGHVLTGLGLDDLHHLLLGGVRPGPGRWSGGGGWLGAVGRLGLLF